jgi:hypothetical protein
MDSMILILFGGALGAGATYWLYTLFRKKEKKDLTQHQSSVLLEKMRAVCKLISVEGEFAEIYTYENSKEGFMKLWSSKKKALIVINAKAHIGYDLKKIKMFANREEKTIVLSHFPEPQILSVEPELKFYDVKNGLFNSFSPSDLTQLTQEAKEHIKQKIPQSGLMESAKNEAIGAVHLMGQIVATIGWSLDTSALEIPETEKNPLLDQ